MITRFRTPPPHTLSGTGLGVVLLVFLFVLTGCATVADAEPPRRLGRPYLVQPGETLAQIGRRHGLGYVEMLAANPGIDPLVPEPGTSLWLPTVHLQPEAPQAGIVVNLSDMRLYWYPAGNGLPRSFPVGIGREELGTPPGEAVIVRKTADPVWYPTARMRRENPDLPAVVPAGPDNPLGSHALYLNRDVLRIHGTNKPWGVGSRVSSGCMRLYPEDIPVLYEEVHVKTPVRIITQEAKAAWIGGALYLEVHPSMAQADALEFNRSMGSVMPPAGLADLVRRMAAQAVPAGPVTIDWAAVQQAAAERRGYPVRIGIPSAPVRQQGEPLDLAAWFY